MSIKSEQVQYYYIEDVTDPRNPFPAAIIKGSFWKYNSNAIAYPDNKEFFPIGFGNSVHYIDNHTSGALHGHTFAVIECSGVVVNHSDDPTPQPPDLARYVVLDLTGALSLVSGQSTNEIDIDDASQRSSAHLHGSSVMTETVYLGYIEQDGTTKDVSGVPIRWHTEYIWCERMQGIFMVFSDGFAKCTGSTVTYIDWHELGTICGHANASSTTAFVTPTRIMEHAWNCDHTTRSEHPEADQDPNLGLDSLADQGRAENRRVEFVVTSK